MAEAPGEFYQEREKRVIDAIQLKIPGRVPVVTGMGNFPANCTGTGYKVACL